MISDSCLIFRRVWSKKPAKNLKNACALNGRGDVMSFGKSQRLPNVQSCQMPPGEVEVAGSHIGQGWHSFMLVYSGVSICSLPP